MNSRRSSGRMGNCGRFDAGAAAASLLCSTFSPLALMPSLFFSSFRGIFVTSAAFGSRGVEGRLNLFFFIKIKVLLVLLLLSSSLLLLFVILLLLIRGCHCF